MVPLSMSNPQTKFEVNRSKHSRVIAWEPFSDGAIWGHQAAPPGALLDRNLPLSMSNTHTKFEMNRSKHPGV